MNDSTTSAGPLVHHCLLSRPQPRRTHRPSRSRNKSPVLRDTWLDVFFPTVSGQNDDSASEGDVSIPEQEVAGAAEHLPRLPSSPDLEEEEDQEERRLTYPCGVEAAAGGRGPQDVGGGNESEEEARCWQRHPAVEHVEDGGRLWVKERTNDEGVRTQLQEEGDSGIITMKGRSVQSLTAFLEKHDHMYKASRLGVLEGSYTEGGALYHLSTDDDNDDEDENDDSSVDSNLTDEYDSLAEIVSWTGGNSFAENFPSKVDSGEVDFPAEVSSETNSSPKVEFLTEEPPAKGDFPCDGDFLPVSRGAAAAAGSPDDPAEVAYADLSGLSLTGAVIGERGGGMVRPRRHRAKDNALTLENNVTEVFGSAHKNHVRQDSSKAPADETEVLGKPLDKEAMALGTLMDEAAKFKRKFSDEIVMLRRLTTEDAVKAKRSLSEEILSFRRPENETLTLGEPSSDEIVTSEMLITEDSGSSSVRSLSSCPVPEGTGSVTQPMTHENTEGGTITQGNHQAEKEDSHGCSLNEAIDEALATLNTLGLFTDSPVRSGKNKAKEKQGRGTPPSKPPRIYLEPYARRTLAAGAVNNTYGDDVEVAVGPSLRDGDDQTSTVVCVESATVEKEDDNDMGAEDLSLLHKPPIQSDVDSDVLDSHESRSKLSRAGCVIKRNGASPGRSPGAGTSPKMLPQGTKRKPKKPPRLSLQPVSLNLPPVGPSLQPAGRTLELEKDQEACPVHGAVLKFYCAKCRVVICRECKASAHRQQESHRVLDSYEALAKLRTEAVSLQRHYTLLRSLHSTLAANYQKYTRGRHQNLVKEKIASGLRLEDGRLLEDIVQEAETLVSSGSNLRKIRERLREWERRQHEWGDVVYLAHRGLLLANVTAATDRVYLRTGDWVMPTPWIQLSHMLQPYLEETPLPSRDMQASPSARKRSPSPSRARKCSGAKDQCFPNNAGHVLLTSLIPYIIFNPDIRYFIHVSNHRDLDLTLVVAPSEDHSREYLKRLLRSVVVSTGALPRNGILPLEYSLMTVERLLMMGGRHHTRLTSSYMTMGTPGTQATPAVAKVSFPDVDVTAGGHKLPSGTGSIKRGDLVVDQDSNGRSSLAVAVRDLGDVPALRLGHVVLGLDGFTYLMEAEDLRRNESSGFRNKILSTVRREEAAVYEVTFGMDL